MTKHIFHVHTNRCDHASSDSDDAYIKKALALGANKITFTDHAPFPGDLFSGRMMFSQLPEYIASLKALKKAYEDLIDVKIGLEIEYLPSFLSYYESLKNNLDIDCLLLGQHHYELKDGTWSFQYDLKNLHIGLMKAQIEGIRSGYFDVIAHPDRCLMYGNGWTSEVEALSKQLIKEATDHQVVLEKNLSSMRFKKMYWTEFWDLVPKEAKTIVGCDAHSVNQVM